MPQLKGFSVSDRRRAVKGWCPCKTWAMLLSDSLIEGHHPDCDQRHQRFPTSCWNQHDTEKGWAVRALLIRGAMGARTARVVPLIHALIGADTHDNREISVSIPFLTRTGKTVTLLGGWIHATHHITWDVLDADSPCGDYDDESELFPTGLSCISTVELIRALRVI